MGTTNATTAPPAPQTRSASAVVPTDILMTSNQRLHHHERAKRTRQLRSTFHALAADLAPLASPVTVTFQLTFRRNHRRDSPNWWPSAKAAIDGIVSAGVLVDDSDKHITATTIPAHDVNPELPEQHACLTITITEDPK